MPSDGRPDRPSGIPLERSAKGLKPERFRERFGQVNMQDIDINKLSPDRQASPDPELR